MRRGVTTVSGQWEVSGLGGHNKPSLVLDLCLRIKCLAFVFVLLSILGKCIGMKKVWLDKDSHTIPMVCFGLEKDHMVFSALRAREIGEQFLAASKEAFAVIESRVDQALLDKERAKDADQG